MQVFSINPRLESCMFVDNTHIAIFLIISTIVYCISIERSIFRSRGWVNKYTTLHVLKDKKILMIVINFCCIVELCQTILFSITENQFIYAKLYNLHTQPLLNCRIAATKIKKSIANQSSKVKATT